MSQPEDSKANLNKQTPFYHFIPITVDPNLIKDLFPYINIFLKFDQNTILLKISSLVKWKANTYVSLNNLRGFQSRHST